MYCLYEIPYIVSIHFYFIVNNKNSPLSTTPFVHQKRSFLLLFADKLFCFWNHFMTPEVDLIEIGVLAVIFKSLGHMSLLYYNFLYYIPCILEYSNTKGITTLTQ